MQRSAIAALICGALSIPGIAAVITVGEGDSIAEALDRANPGDTVRLTGREYPENVVIDVPITLLGAVDEIDGGAATGDAMPRIRGGYQGNVVHVTAPGTVIAGVHISEAGPHLTQDMTCLLIEADSVTVRDGRISESLHGIYVKAGNRTKILRNRIQGRLDLIEADRGNGIHLWNSSGNLIADNEIFDVRDGIYFSFANNTRVENNNVHHARYGLHYMYSNENAFTDNLFEQNVGGAALMYSKEIEFSRNTFARNRGYRAYGILLQSMDRVTAHSNLILDNSRGIFLNNSGENLFQHNDIVDNDLAIQLNGGCEANRFVGNNFLGNLSELLLDVSDRNTLWSDGTRGNHWSRYPGYDLDRDGVGDVPFGIQNVFQVMEGKVPEVRFYLLSPAAEILRAAERSLPILSLGDVEDPSPLMRPSVNHDVPWAVAREISGEKSLLWAGLYLVGTLAPLTLLVRLGARP